MKETHIPVLKSEVLEVLQPQTGESYLDLTAGYAGHASEILAATQNYKDSVLVDRDPNACKVLHEKFDKFPVEILQKDFYSSTLHLLKCGKTFDMILVDLGVSSPQLDNPERGFSFMNDGPLDMRMDTTQDLTAEKIVNTYKREDLVRILTEYGDESIGLARKHARMICEGRPFHTTGELAAVFGPRRGHRHPATQAFQAIRIAVNGEMDLLNGLLVLLPELLNPGGRVAIITFHSIEDRIVKRYFKEQSTLGKESPFTLINKKPLVAGDVELGSNPRSRSAKLRAARKNF